MTTQSSVTSVDLALLWEINPLAQAQLTCIVKTRLLVEAEKRIAELEKQAGTVSKNSKVKTEVGVS